MATGEELRARYGTPERLADREREVLVFLHQSQESAEAFATANREGDAPAPAWTECRDGQWLSVVDIRPLIAAVRAQFEDGVA